MKNNPKCQTTKAKYLIVPPAPQQTIIHCLYQQKHILLSSLYMNHSVKMVANVITPDSYNYLNVSLLAIWMAKAL